MHKFALAFVLLLSITPFYSNSPLFQTTSISSNENVFCGPYVDEIHFEIIPEIEDEIQALLDGQIDLIGSNIPSEYIDQLNSSDEILVTSYLENGYTYLSLNCEKYPLNISEFRRALALVIDKKEIVNESFSMQAQPLDVVIPSQNPFSIENELDASYYNSNSTQAIDLLKSEGFNDSDEDGWLEGPGPQGPGTVELEDITIEGFSSTENTILIDVFIENLASIGIQAKAVYVSDFEELELKVENHLDYNIILLDVNFQNYRIDWLASAFGSDYANISGFNLANFRNSTFDDYIHDLICSTEIHDIQFASQEMQKILLLECPFIPCYQKQLFSAVRINKFENYVNDTLQGSGGWWTNYQIRLKENESGPISGTLIRSLPIDIDSLNFMESSSQDTLSVLNNLYDTLLIQTPEGEIIPWLAESYSLQNIEGNTRITFKLCQNASWSNSHPISAYDIAFSINYFRDSGLYPNKFSNLYSAYAKNDYTFVVEYLEESYWYIYDFLDLKIIPKHVFINIPDPFSWNPKLDDVSDAIHVTSGPFILSSYSKGESISLIKNLQYFRLPFSNHEFNLNYREDSISPPIEDKMIASKCYTESLSSDFGAEIIWTSNDKTYPTLVMNNSYLHGDHVTINATWTNINITNATLNFYSYSEKSQTLVIPDPAYNPYIGVIDTTQFSWIFIENIKKDERVEVLADFSNTDCDFMAWWADTDNGTWEYSNNLLHSSMSTNLKPENGSFVADRDGELAIGCFDYDQIAGTWTVTVTSGSRHIIGPYENNTILIDTYDILDDGTWSIHFTGIDNDTTLNVILNNITISNSFYPVVEILKPNGGVIIYNCTVTWNATDVNVDDTLTHEVRVSNDGGTSYMLLAARLNDSSIFWNLTEWIRLSTYIIKVISSDGVLQGSDTSDSNITAGDLSIIDFTAPIILGLNEVNLEYSNESIILSWFASDFHTGRFSIILNGSIYKSGFWNSGNLSIQFENYTIGTYNFTIVVYDSSNNMNSSQTIVSIINTTSTTITTTTTTTTTTSENTSPTTITTTITTLNGLMIAFGTIAVICFGSVIIIILIYNQKRIHLRTE